MKLVGMVLSALLLVGCGGGGGGGTGGIAPTPTPTPGDGGATPPSVQLALMVDSLGRTIPESNFGGGDSDAAGADGSAGDGAPIANAPVVLVDNAGHTATATTDALGYYRVNVKGFTPPFVVKVTRPDGTVWYSHSTSPVKTRGFVTMNITGLTDKVGGYVADANNVSGGAEKVTPLLLATNPTALQTSKTKLTTNLTSPLAYVGLSPTTFDPIASAYQAIKTDKYDRMLERLAMSKDPSTGNTVVVGTLAGAKESLINGVGSTATFSEVNGVAVDGGGNVFVADSDNNVIRKITPTGRVDTFAGSGIQGFADGDSGNARFNRPIGVAVDTTGNVFVADSQNNRIRKITPMGVVSTLAGNGLASLTNGTGSAASFSFPNGIAVDAGGNVYVGDSDNHVIRKITSGGLVSTLAGSGSSGFANGTSTSASFNKPQGVAVDSNGNVFVGDSHNFAVRKVTPAGTVSTLAASGFSYVAGVALDGIGNVFVADFGGHAIRKISSSGFVSTVAGGSSLGFVNGGGEVASFRAPWGVALDSSGNVFVGDSGNHAIRTISSAGVVSTLAGSGSSGFTDGTGTVATFFGPTGVTLSSNGDVYVADTYNYAVRKITPSGVVSTLAGSGRPGFVNGAGAAASFNLPFSLAVDSSGNVFVADAENHAIRKITSAGLVSTFAGNGSQGFANGIGVSASFSRPSGVVVDSAGNVLVADTGNHAIRKITPGGVVSTFAGGIRGFTDGVGTLARFSSPGGVTLDRNNNVFVADADNGAIRKITPAGLVSTLVDVRLTGYNLGLGSDTNFRFPLGIVVDNIDNVYVAAGTGILKITYAGVVTPFVGDGRIGYVNGSLTNASLGRPSGVALGSSGNMYVGDTDNNAIRVILP